MHSHATEVPRTRGGFRTAHGAVWSWPGGALLSRHSRIALQAVVNHSIVSPHCLQHSTEPSQSEDSISLPSRIQQSFTLTSLLLHRHMSCSNLIACGPAMKCASAAALHRAVDGAVLVFSTGEVQSSDQNATLTGVRKLLEPATTFVVPFVHCCTRVHQETMTPKFNHTCAAGMWLCLTDMAQCIKCNPCGSDN